MLLRLGWLGTYAQAQHDDSGDVVGQGTIPIIHDQDIAISEARIAADLGLTDHIGLSLVLPVRVVSTAIVYRDGMGAPVQLTQPNVHHRNETLTGFADPMLLGAYTHVLAGFRLIGRAGMSLPLGRTEHDPFELGDMGMPHQHIQMGTGTVNPIAALEVSRAFAPWQAGGFLFTQQIVYENGKGYQAGDRYAAGLSLRRALGAVWSVRGGPEFQAETAERWNGIRHTEEGNQGRIDVLLGAGVAWSALPQLTVDFSLKVPLYTHVVGGQLAVPAIVEASVAWTFGKPRAHQHDHEHGEHEHGDEHGEHEHEHAGHDDHDAANAEPHAKLDTSGADVADLGAEGQRVDLTPVPGKITIFDFWAHWCEPCKTLEPVLIEIARANPNVAIRRVEVDDWDDPVAKQHLTPGGFDLPHIKIKDARGGIVLEQSSGPGKLQALIDAVRAIAQAPSAQTATVTPEDQRPPSEPDQRPPPRPKRHVVDIVATEKGFEPADIKVPRKRMVVLRFVRKAAKTCATEVILDHAGKRIVKDLPLDKQVDLELVFENPGTVTYRCAMDMFRGTITVQ